MKTFEIGNVYATRSACDHDCIFSYRLIKRTAKRATLVRLDNNGDPYGKPFARGISAWYDDSKEAIYPEGKYSMCPILTAEKGVI